MGKCETCKTCKHIERWQCGSKFFFYCNTRLDFRTHNGMLKVKCKLPACAFYKEKGKNEIQS